jgi:hypothetical protein
VCWPTAVALGTTELVAGLLAGAPSLVLSVGSRVVDTVPGAVEAAAIALLGTADKPVLLAGVLVLSGVVGALLGRLAARRFVLGAAVLVAFAVLGGAAALADPQARALPVLLVVEAAALAGVGALWLLLRAARAPVGSAGASAARGRALDRRSFLRAAVAGAVVAAAGGLAGQLLETRQKVGRLRAAVLLPRPVRALAAAPAGASLEVPGLTPLYVPNARFYRIDTALRVPQVDPSSWSLRVHGEVERPFRLSYDELLASRRSRPTSPSPASPTRWAGPGRQRPLAGRSAAGAAGAGRGAPGGTQLLGRSVDGFTAGFPTETR